MELEERCCSGGGGKAYRGIKVENLAALATGGGCLDGGGCMLGRAMVSKQRLGSLGSHSPHETPSSSPSPTVSVHFIHSGWLGLGPFLLSL